MTAERKVKGNTTCELKGFCSISSSCTYTSKAEKLHCRRYRNVINLIERVIEEKQKK